MFHTPIDDCVYNSSHTHVCHLLTSVIHIFLKTKMTDYSPPKWMKPPQGNNHWRLDEIKSGVIVNSYNIKVPLVIFGRTPPPPLPPIRMDHRTDTTSTIPPGTSVEEETQQENKGYLTILTVHESCSRLHARIAFDSNGIPWLRDLGSGNGTKGKEDCAVFDHI